MKTTKHPLHFALLIAMLYCCLGAFAQGGGSPAIKLAGIIEKITTNPATGYLDNYQREGNPSDGSAIIYLKPEYRGKIKDVVFHTFNLPDKARNPMHKVVAENDIIYLQNLYAFQYEILTIDFKDGTSISSSNHADFWVKSCNRKQIPFGGELADYTKDMEGNNVALFKTNFALGSLVHAKLSATQIAANALLSSVAVLPMGRVDPEDSTTITQLMGGCDMGTWYADNTPADNDPIYGYVRAVHNNCGIYVLVRCAQELSSNPSTDGKTFYVIAGDFYDANMQMRSYTGQDQLLVSLPRNCPSGNVYISGGSCTGASLSGTVDGGIYTNAGTFDNAVWIRPDGSRTYETYNITASTPGDYTLRILNGSCSWQKTVTIYGAPSAPGLSKTDATCSSSTGSINVTSANGGTQFSLDGGAWQASGTFNSVSVGGHNVKSRNSGNCESSNTGISIAAGPTAPAAPSATVTPATCVPTAASITIAIVAGATYSFDNGVTYQSSNVKAGLLPNTNYLLKVKIGTICISAATTKNTGPVSGTAPTISIVTDKTNFCAGTTATTTATVSPAGGNVQWQWRRLDASGTAITGWNNAGYGTATTYGWAPGANEQWQATYTTACGTTTSNIVGATVRAVPVAAMVVTTPSVSCVGTTVGFNASVSNSTITGEIYTYYYEYSKDNGSSWTWWFTGSGSNSQPGGAYTPNVPGLWKFRVTVSNSCGSNVVSTSVVIVKETKPNPIITGMPTTACKGAIIVFTPSVTNSVAGETYTYTFKYSNDNGATFTQWYTGSNTSSWPSASYGPVDAGLWKFRVIIDNGCGKDSVTSQTVTVSSPAVPVLAKVDPTCTTATGTITVNPADPTFTYSINGGAYAAAASWGPFAAGSSHNVTAKNASGCISDVASISLLAQPTALVATINSNQTVCTKDTVTLSATGGTTYVWTKDSPTGTVVGNTATIKVSPLVATNYYVKVTNGNCSDAKTVLVQAPRPSLILTSVITICQGNTQDVIADNGGISGYTYHWIAPASVVDSIKPILHNMAPTVTTAYTVERTTPNGCKDTATSIINVFVQPIIGTVEKTDAGCSSNNGTITIHATSPSHLQIEYSITGNTWQADSVFTNLTPGTYSILAKNKNGVCQAITGSNVTITRLSGPIDTIRAQSVTCAFESVQYVADPATLGATYVWSATGNPTVTGTTLTSTYVATWSTPGVYEITMVATKDGCIVTRKKSINVSNAIVADAGVDKIICQGGITKIGTAPPNNSQVSYSWSPTTGLNDATVATPNANPVRNTVYTLTVTNPVTGCVRSDDVEVKVDVTRNPRADAGPDQIFAGAGTTLTVGTNNTTNTPWTTNGSTFNLTYTWTGTDNDPNADRLDDSWERITNFNVPSGAASTYTYVLDVSKEVPVGSEAGNPIYQYCHSYDTVVLVKMGSVSISGSLWENLNSDNIIDAGETKTNGGKKVYAVLTDNAGKVIATTLVAADGSYTFLGVAANTTGLKVIADTISPVIGSVFATPIAPTTWSYQGSQTGTNNTNTTKGNGFVGVNTGTANVTGVNIGFKQQANTICFSIKVLLQGSLMNNGGGLLMRDNLRNSPFTGKNYIPKNDPYTTPDYSNKFTAKLDGLSTQWKSVIDSAAIFGAKTIPDNNITDWVFVELRDKNNPDNVISTRSVLVQRNGNVIDVDGGTCIHFPLAPADDYYVSVRHRNHLGAMTALAISKASLTNGTVVDFSTMTAAQLWNTADVGGHSYDGLEQATVNGAKALWAGNAIGDNKIKYVAPNDDLSQLLLDVLIHPGNTMYLTNYDAAIGYFKGDMDMNSKAKYVAPNDDGSLLLLQMLVYPLNPQYFTNFDFFLQQLPTSTL